MTTILQVVPELETGGVERTAVDIAQACRARGWRALVASQGGRLVAELEAVGGEHIAMPLASKNPFIMAANAGRLAEIVRREQVSLVHARSRAPAWSALHAARKTAVPFVTTYHGAYGQKNALKSLYNSVMARGDAVIANSHYTAGLIRDRHGVSGERVTVIHRGTNIAEIAHVPQERIATLRTAWGVDAGTRVVLQLARLTAWKGQGVTIDAFAALEPTLRSGCMLILAGDAQGRENYVSELEARIAEHGLAGRVRLVGHCADVAAAMNAADVVAVSSIEPEAFGRAAVEAQAAGRPVIVSDLGAVPETVIAPPQVAANERTGWRIAANDSPALAETLQEALMLDPAGREALAARARANAARFSLEAMCDATLAVYSRLLV
ncbi:glycosyltransferase involved in cell wall biosynthesis [Breoghania corrubedonensis]|uniref:Glycosyltransferase involved in cell wall biosynthesis n=1 Tax=Breoghania corrubedonensis TaxID=665038 RepID=A0A2T5VFL7_9HYPH|nr:glycosyltransferase family 4 protein [Breoghania corrubedonensis]PTW62543.1 glycosyltransferase involved in cell wall biosynthesis [Breoghania corrubedonensis]